MARVRPGGQTSEAAVQPRRVEGIAHHEDRRERGAEWVIPFPARIWEGMLVGRESPAESVVDANSERQLWAETYDREVTDLFGVQTEIARADRPSPPDADLA